MGAKDPCPLPDETGVCWNDDKELYRWTPDTLTKFVDTTDSEDPKPNSLPGGWVYCSDDTALRFHSSKNAEIKIEPPDEIVSHPVKAQVLLRYDDNAVFLDLDTEESRDIELTIGIEELVGFSDRPLLFTEDGSIRDDSDRLIWSGCLPGIVGRNGKRICGPGGALWDGDGNRIEEVPAVEWMLAGSNGFYLFTDDEILYLDNDGGLREYAELPFPISSIDIEAGHMILHGVDDIEMEMPFPEENARLIESKTVFEDEFVCSDAWSNGDQRFIIDEDGSFYRVDRMVKT